MCSYWHKKIFPFVQSVSECRRAGMSTTSSGGTYAGSSNKVASRDPALQPIAGKKKPLLNPVYKAQYKGYRTKFHDQDTRHKESLHSDAPSCNNPKPTPFCRHREPTRRALNLARSPCFSASNSIRRPKVDDARRGIRQIWCPWSKKYRLDYEQFLVKASAKPTCHF